MRFIMSPRDAQYTEMIHNQQNWREATDPQTRSAGLSRVAQWMAGR